MKNIVQKVLILGASEQIARHVIDQLIDYELTARNERFKGTVVSRKSVAALIADMIDKPEKYIGENIGVNQRGTDGDKPYFM